MAFEFPSHPNNSVVTIILKRPLNVLIAIRRRASCTLIVLPDEIVAESLQQLEPVNDMIKISQSDLFARNMIKI